MTINHCCFGEPCDRDRVNVPLTEYVKRILPNLVDLCPRHLAYALGEASPPPAAVPHHLYPQHTGCGGALIPHRKPLDPARLPYAPDNVLVECTKCGGTASGTFVTRSEAK